MAKITLIRINNTLLSLILLLFSFGCHSPTPGYYHEKYSPPPNRQKPNRIPNHLHLQKQTEGHTCGYHAISTIYLAHELDPHVKNLRFRLGVDKPALPLNNETLGSIHSDIFRIAAQDGFNLSTIDPNHFSTPTNLCDWLNKKRYVLTLIQRKENDNLHWVVFESCQNNMLTVYDSLFSEPYQVKILDFLQKHVLSLILFEPANTPETVNVWSAHKEGIIEMNKVRKRIKSRSPFRK